MDARFDVLVLDPDRVDDAQVNEPFTVSVPAGEIDTAMAAMLMLLAAVDEGLGGWFFGIFHGEDKLRSEFSVPPGFEPIGVLGFGYPAPQEKFGGSARFLSRRPLDEIVHWGRW